MSDDKTEKPTNQKLKKARERGEVAKSTFLAGALIFVGGVLLIGALHTLLALRFQKSMKVAFKLTELDGAFYKVIEPLLFPVLSIMVAILLIAIGSHLFQTGWMWIWPKRQKRGGGRRYVLPLLALAVIGGVGYLNIRAFYLRSSIQVETVYRTLFMVALEIGALLLFLGLCDLFYQKWRYYKQMHMTPEEKKQEQRENEGDQQSKGEMRSRRGP